MSKFLYFLLVLLVPQVAFADTYATWNPADNFVTLSGGNLVATANGAWNGVRATIFKTSGKWYWEYTLSGCSVDNGDSQMGIGDSGDISSTGSVPSANTAIVYANSGQLISAFDNTGVQAANQFRNGDTIGVGLDMDTPTLRFYDLSGAEMVNSPWAQVTGSSMTAEAILNGSGCTVTANFGASAFVHSVPSGFNSGLYTASGGGGSEPPYTGGEGGVMATTTNAVLTPDSYELYFVAFLSSLGLLLLARVTKRFWFF